MRSGLQKLGIALAALILTGLLSLSTTFAAGKADTFTGQVSDAMCGAKHMMAGNPAAGTRALVGKGAKCALVGGVRVSARETENETALDSSNQLAGARRNDDGTVNY